MGSSLTRAALVGVGLRPLADRRHELQPATVGLQAFMGPNTSDWKGVMTYSAIYVTPILAVFVLLQPRIAFGNGALSVKRGLMHGGAGGPIVGPSDADADDLGRPRSKRGWRRALDTAAWLP